MRADGAGQAHRFDGGGEGAADTSAPRLAIYFVPPPSSPLATFGEAWFEGDLAAETGLAPERIAALTKSARMYGFHATLKPPMRLAAGRQPEELADALASFCAAREAFRVAAPEVVLLDGFLALRPGAPAPALDALAAECVAAFDGFRAPPGEAELVRRRQAGLSERQEALFRKWGYPYVFEEFRFHMTLSARLSDSAEIAALTAAARRLAAPALARPLTIDAVALSRQAGPGAAFEVVARFPFGRSPGASRS